MSDAQTVAEGVSGVLTPGEPVRPRESRPRASNEVSCSTCQQAWTGLAVAHCGACHETFSGVGLFDRHRDQHGDRGKCLDPATITKGSPIVWRDGMWRGPEMDEATKAKRFGSR